MIKLYSTGCPKCIMLEHRLDACEIPYEKVSKMNEIFEVAKKYDIKEAPFIVKDDKVYNFTEAVKNIDSFR